MALKLDENRRHVSTYNTLEETHGLLEKEVSARSGVRARWVADKRPHTPGAG